MTRHPLTSWPSWRHHAGMTTTGVVKLTAAGHAPAAARPAGRPATLDTPPPLDDEKQAAQGRSPGCGSAARTTDINDAIHRVRWVGLNAVRPSRPAPPAAELLGTGTGDADQRYPLTQHPVLAGSTRAAGRGADRLETGKRSTTFVAQRPRRPALCAWTTTAGAVRVRRAAGARRSASGSGCCPTATAAGSPATCRPAAVDRDHRGRRGAQVANPLPAAGGADAVGSTEALDAIPAEVHRRDRAVVAEDFRDLACRCTGVARAESLPLLHPDTPTVHAAGRGQRGGLPGRGPARPERAAARPRPAAPGGRLPRPAPAGHHRAVRDPADLPAGRGLGRGAGARTATRSTRCAAGSS